MCGISAIINFDQRPVNIRSIEAMNLAVQHRGPDGSGVLVDGAVGLGHVRLSIIDVDPRASQPMSRNGRVLSYNGEIYNYVELRKCLEARGYHFTTTSDTEVLLVALQEWGHSALERLRGMFAFVYYDPESNEIWAVRDRFGIKPLVYAHAGGSIIFASEAKQILKTGFLKAVANKDKIYDYLHNGSINTSHETLFSGINEIIPGSIAIISLTNKTINFKKWYKLSNSVKHINISYLDAVEGVREHLKNSILRHYKSDVPIGISLSGGIDSSCIVSMSRFLFPKKDLNAISIFNSHKDFNEINFSRPLSKIMEVNSIEVEVDTSHIWDPDLHQELGYYHDQPIPSGSHYNEYSLFRAARENGLIVMLGGQGADEYFGGYGEFWFSMQCELLNTFKFKDFLKQMKVNSKTMGRSLNIEFHNFITKWLSASRRKSQNIGPYRVEWLRNHKKMYNDPRKDFLSLSLEQIQSTSIPYQLHSEDRNSMRWSIESRVPFLDHDLVEFVMGLPNDYKIGGGYRKRILRDASHELPIFIKNRKDKMGFPSPDYFSLKGKEENIKECLYYASKELKDIIDFDIVIKHFDKMIIQNSWYSPIFFRIIALDAWRRAHNVVF
jgi:asparagine synthase (glutamine-hydrolysing)